MTTEQLIQQRADELYTYKEYDGVMGPVSRSMERERIENRRKEFIEAATFGASLRDEEVIKLRQALCPLAMIDLTGIKGHVIYQRNKSVLYVVDILIAKGILDTYLPKNGT